jgi:trans-aconitate methyltransferase
MRTRWTRQRIRRPTTPGTQTRADNPDLRFEVADARDFAFEAPFDAIFSNAVLHWVQDQDALLECVSDALVPGGRFVAECGGTGNVAAIVDAVTAEVNERGYQVENPWYFPSVGEYSTKLESHGFEVRYARLFDRPTKLENGEDGLEGWVEMFGDSLLAHLSEDEQAAVIEAVEARLRDDLFQDGDWYADYRRLRFVAMCDEA